MIGLVSGGLGVLLGVGLAAGIRSLLDLIGVEIPSTFSRPGDTDHRRRAGRRAAGDDGRRHRSALAATRVAPMEALRNAAPASGAVGCGVPLDGSLRTGSRCSRVRGRRQPAVGDGVRHPDDVYGLVVAGPLWPEARSAGRPRSRGGGWRMAACNIARNSRRSAATALALTIGLTVVAAVAVTATSLKESVSAAVAGQPSGPDPRARRRGPGISLRGHRLLRPRRRRRRRRAARVRCPGQRPQLPGRDGHHGLDQVIDLGIESGSPARSSPAASWSARPQPTSWASAPATR